MTNFYCRFLCVNSLSKKFKKKLMTKCLNFNLMQVDYKIKLILQSYKIIIFM